MITIIGALEYNNQYVGCRVELKRESGKVLGVFDISNDDLHLIRDDFNIMPSQDNQRYQKIILQERGNLLEPVNAPNVPEMTYAKFAHGVRGIERLSKTDTDLKKLYNHYNKLCFNGELPTLVAVEWSTRMTSSAGKCYWKKKYDGYIFTIKLSTHYHERYPNEVIDTLVHEMIHVYHPRDHHGPLFKSTMNRINREHGMNLTLYATGKAKVNYVYACEDCGYEYERVKRINTALARCGVRGCGGALYLQQDNTGEDDYFDNTDWLNM